MPLGGRGTHVSVESYCFLLLLLSVGFIFLWCLFLGFLVFFFAIGGVLEWHDEVCKDFLLEYLNGQLLVLI